MGQDIIVHSIDEENVFFVGTPVREGQHGRRHFHEQPGHDRLGHTYPKDVTAFEFGDQCHLSCPG